MAVNLRFSTNISNGKKSLGGPVDTTASGIYSPNTTAADVFFDEVLKSENIAGTPDYRCVYIKNDNTSQTVYSPQFEFLSFPNTDKFQIGLLTDKNVSATTIADENTAPAGINFQTVSVNTPIDLIQGDNKTLLPGEFIGFWLKRTPANLGASGTVISSLQFQIRYKN